MAADVGDKDDVVGVAHNVHSHQRAQQRVALDIVDKGQQARGLILAGEVSLHHGHVAVVVVGCRHVFTGAVHIVGTLAVKHPEHRHELAHADEHLAVLALDDVGTFQVGRYTKGFLDVRGVDVAHALAHEFYALVLEVAEHALGRDKRRAVGIDDLHLDVGAHLTARLVPRPQDTDDESNREHCKDAILYQPFQRRCFLNSKHI